MVTATFDSAVEGPVKLKIVDQNRFGGSPVVLTMNDASSQQIASAPAVAAPAPIHPQSQVRLSLVTLIPTKVEQTLTRTGVKQLL